MSNSLVKTACFQLLTFLMGIYRTKHQKLIKQCFVSYFVGFMTQQGDPIYPQVDQNKCMFRKCVQKLSEGVWSLFLVSIHSLWGQKESIILFKSTI